MILNREIWDETFKTVKFYFESQPISVILTTAFVSIIVWRVVTNLWRDWALPPGPVGLPIVGYLPFLSNQDMHRQFYDMTLKYGSILSVYLGGLRTVIIHDFETQKETGKLDEYSVKPSGIFSFSDDSTHLADMNGKPWREQKKFLLTTLRNVGISKLKVEESIKEQINRTIEVFETKTGDIDVNIREVLSPAVNNVIMSLVCGKTFDRNHEKINMLSEFQFKVMEYFEKMEMVYLFPMLFPLRRFYVQLVPSLRKLKRELQEFENRVVKEEIEEHQKDFDGVEKKDYIDHYLSEIQQTDVQNSSFDVANLLGNSQLLLVAGTETVRSTMEWTLLCLARYQLVQEMVYQEINRVIGTEREPEWKDRDSLVTLQATVLEVTRYKSLLTFSDPRVTDQDVQLKGYTIPKGTQVLMNFWAVHNDKDYWGDPENFRPERFLSSDLKSIVNTERVIPFGVGKRSCPGSKLAEVEVFLFVTSLLQKFRFLPPEKGVCMDEITVLTRMVVSPFIRLQLR